MAADCDVRESSFPGGLPYLAVGHDMAIHEHVGSPVEVLGHSTGKRARLSLLRGIEEPPRFVADVTAFLRSAVPSRS